MERNGTGAIASLPKLGLGLGLRSLHFDQIIEQQPAIAWFEAISENFMDSGGRPRWAIRAIAEHYPVVLHGVSLSIGSTDPLNFPYLGKLKALAEEVKPAWVSDHLCWTGVQGINSHDLLPIPLTEETLSHVAARVHQVQDFLERPLILENPSTYLTFTQSTLTEPEFLRQLVEETGCGLLLDVNNVYVTCFNTDADPLAYLDSFPWSNVIQIHLAGHQHCGTHIIDTHDRAVEPAVWELYRLARSRSQGASTLLEWDGNIPSLAEYHAELLKAKQYMDENGKPMAIAEVSFNNKESVSTPVDFLVPEVMGNTIWEQK
ncbi:MULTISPECIES: DUF692 domain-containing protein [Spirulina sp. CCY15215]|uniref:MNIO family bufferin maturase n=1 Tax=Spirulina sp. CCY15215 TaxID=2767591 RepID=UPI001EF2AAEC|nr:DUF692 domain-containing protein [Spirulina major]